MLLPGGGVETPVLGSDLGAGERPQVLVPGCRWQAAESLGDWSLLGTTMAPGFRSSDFELGSRAELLNGWPDAVAVIDRHTPPGTPILDT
jgi:predicted cupin superfamily sugar epimerase